MDMTDDGLKVWWCEEQYCIGTWNVRSMNQSKLEVVEQEMARVNMNILVISELKWMGMSKFNSVQFSLVAQLCLTLWPHELQHARPPCPTPIPRVYSKSCPLSRRCHSNISSSVVLFSSCPQTSQHQGLFKWVHSSHKVAKILEFQLQHQSFQRILTTDLL